MNSTQEVTLNEIMAWKPCGWDGEHDGENYTRQRVAELIGGRETVRADDIQGAPISIVDKVWLALHFLAEVQQHEFACRCAERVIYLCGDDARPRQAIAVKRAWLRGEIDDNELTAAASWVAAWAATWDADAVGAAVLAAALAAARDAALAAAWVAALAAAGAIALAVAGDAAMDAERQWQLDEILRMINESS